MTDSNTYHHGNLRRALLNATLEAIADKDPGTLSLRAVAKAAGVSHAAPAHHFGDKTGLLTCLATEGYQKFATELESSWENTRNFSEMGVAYVRFAINNPTYFSLMYRLELLRTSDVELQSARKRAHAALYTGAHATTSTDVDVTATAAWSLVHGYATLYLSGGLSDDATADPEATARALTMKLKI